MTREAVPVLLDVCGSMNLEDGPEVMRMRVKGRLKQTTQGWILHYTETSCEPGEEPLTQDILIHLTSAQVKMTRTGDFGATLVFSPGQTFAGSYHTPFGDMDLVVNTSEVYWEATEEAGKVHMAYQLSFQGQEASAHAMDISYRALPLC